MATAAPIVVAVTLIGLPYGVLAEAAGIPWWLTVAMSATVFAGSSQFALVSLIAAGASPLGGALSAALLNTRYLATGTAAAGVFRGGRLRRFLLAQVVVDESYAVGVAAGSAERPDARAMTLAGVALYLGWNLGSLAGTLVGAVLGDPERLGLDAAFPALFVALLWPLLRDRPAVRSAAIGAVSALVVGLVAGDGVALLAAAVVGLATYRPARPDEHPGADPGRPRGAADRGRP